MVPASSGAAARAQGVGRPALNGNFRSVPTALTRSKGLHNEQSFSGAAWVTESVTVAESVIPNPNTGTFIGGKTLLVTPDNFLRGDQAERWQGRHGCPQV